MGRKNQLSRQSRSRTSLAASLGAAPFKGGAAMSAYQGASHTDLALSDWQPMAGSADADQPRPRPGLQRRADGRPADFCDNVVALPVQRSPPLLAKAQAWLASLSGWSKDEMPRSTP